MYTRKIDRRIVAGLTGSLGLLCVAPVSFADVDLQDLAALVRPVEADLTSTRSHLMWVTDAGQSGVAGTGGVYCLDLSDLAILFSYAPTSGPGALRDPNAAEALGNGEVMIADTGNHRVLIVNQAGQITWNSANLPFSDGKPILGPVDVQILPDSTPSMADNAILIACKTNDRVVAVKRTGQVVWAVNSGLSAPRKAERLANGNTLIVESQRVIEVNTARRIVASYLPPGPRATAVQCAFTDAERLADGSTLVLDGANGVLFRMLPFDIDPFVLGFDIDDPFPLAPEAYLTGATDVDAIEMENGGLRLLFTTPAGVISHVGSPP